eukprot:gene7462-5258_t
MLQPTKNIYLFTQFKYGNLYLTVFHDYDMYIYIYIYIYNISQRETEGAMGSYHMKHTSRKSILLRYSFLFVSIILLWLCKLYKIGTDAFQRQEWHIPSLWALSQHKKNFNSLYH